MKKNLVISFILIGCTHSTIAYALDESCTNRERAKPEGVSAYTWESYYAYWTKRAMPRDLTGMITASREIAASFALSTVFLSSSLVCASSELSNIRFKIDEKNVEELAKISNKTSKQLGVIGLGLTASYFSAATLKSLGQKYTETSTDLYTKTDCLVGLTSLAVLTIACGSICYSDLIAENTTTLRKK